MSVVHPRNASASIGSQGDRELLFEHDTVFSDEELALEFKEAVDSPEVKWYFLHGPGDVVTVLYLTASLWPYFANPFVYPLWMLLHVGYMTFLVTAPLWIYRDRLVGMYVHWTVRVLMDFHPLLFFSLFYTELGILIPLVGADFRDYVIQQYEEEIFGCQLSQEFHKMLPFRILGEYFCVCYLGYFLFIFLLLALVGFSRPQTDLHVCSATLIFAFVVNFFVFTYYPVEGPYWQLIRVDPSEIGYSVCMIVHSILNNGSAHGTAFPSSHVGIAITLWTLAIRYHHGLALFYLFVIPALCLATVYGGFHYGVDALCGLVFGVVWSTVGHFLMVRLVKFTCVGVSATKKLGTHR